MLKGVEVTNEHFNSLKKHWKFDMILNVALKLVIGIQSSFLLMFELYVLVVKTS